MTGPDDDDLFPEDEAEWIIRRRGPALNGSPGSLLSNVDPQL